MPLAASIFVLLMLRFRSWRSRHARALWLLGAVCVALAVGIVASYGLSSVQDTNVRRSVSWVEHTHEVIEAIDDTLAAAEDVETGEHGFLMTGEASYLEPYWHGLASIAGHLARAQELTKDNVDQQERLQLLGALLHTRLLVAERVVELAQDGDREQALEIIKSGRGKRLMDLARQTVATAAAEEQTLLRARRADWEHTEAWWSRLLVGLLFATATGAGLGVIAFVHISGVRATAKQAVAAAAARQRLLDRMALAAIMVRDFDGPIRFWSHGCESLYGWTAGEAIGQSPHMLLRTTFPEPLSHIEAALRRDGTWIGELRHRTKGGAEVIVAVRKVLIRETDDRLAVMENMTDVTALRQAEEALQESQAELRLVFDTAAEGTVVAQDDGAIISINRAALSMFGYDAADELIGRDLGVLMPTAEAVRHRGHVAAHRSGAPPKIIGVPGRELVAVRRDGSEFPIDLSVSSLVKNGGHRLVGIIRDATARKRAEAAVRDSEARFHAIFDSQFQLIGLLDPDGTMLEANRVTYDVTGLTLDEIRGRPFWEAHAWPDSERDRVRREVAEAASGALIRREVQILGADGRGIWLDYSLKPVRDEATGAIKWIIPEGRDITAQRTLAACRS